MELRHVKLFVTQDLLIICFQQLKFVYLAMFRVQLAELAVVLMINNIAWLALQTFLFIGNKAINAIQHRTNVQLAPTLVTKTPALHVLRLALIVQTKTFASFVTLFLRHRCFKIMFVFLNVNRDWRLCTQHQRIKALVIHASCHVRLALTVLLKSVNLVLRVNCSFYTVLSALSSVQKALQPISIRKSALGVRRAACNARQQITLCV